ncbi:protein GRIM REAPER-like [Zingiber officinale]|uniref:Uncharacterized protein n=1 Tax=Zingiber officinale TaxID=94328 RepID=A0A8J5LFF5_ZINOF|nr:protein GRIM REAPER-like [Zingiber officinale]KAG6512667.1 hypothetical protein ZIOFF_030796 [Zingiber officinale]
MAAAAATTTFFVLALALSASLQFPASARKGGRCEQSGNGIACPGALHCCKRRCRDVLSDRHNCGRCGNRCGFGRLCCAGGCVAVAYDVDNCGGCGRICPPGQRCEYGACGYA